MDETKRQYSNRIKYGTSPKYDAKSLDSVLPEWIMDLKNYFEKKPDSKYSSKSF